MKFSCTVAFFVLCGMLLAQESSLTPLADYAEYQQELELLQRAQEYIDAEKFVKAAEQYRRAAKLTKTSETRAGYLVHEAENLLLGKKSHRAKKVFFDLVNNYRFFIPLQKILEQMRELANYFEHGTGTLMHFPDPATAIEIYREIVKCQPGGSSLSTTSSSPRWQARKQKFASSSPTHRAPPMPQAMCCHSTTRLPTRFRQIIELFII